MTKTRTVVAATLTALLAAGLTATPANAAPATPAIKGPVPPSCTDLSVCGYVNTGYATNQGYELIPTGPSGHCEVVSLRNAWSGVFNNSGRTIRMFRNTSCSGSDYKQFDNGGGHAQFSVRFGPTWDNSVDAIQFR